MRLCCCSGAGDCHLDEAPIPAERYSPAQKISDALHPVALIPKSQDHNVRPEEATDTNFDASTQIRMLVLHGGEPDTPISASYKFVKLDSGIKEGEWEAISYAWKDTPTQEPPNTPPLDVGKERRIVSPVVLAILKDLRLRKEDRFLWIDAVCIKQEVKAEKESQVPLMAEIYQKARSVIIWLPDGGMQDAADAIMAANGWMEKNDGVYDLESPLISCFIKKNKDICWQSPLHRTLRLSWFQRIWVLQEAVLAKTLMVRFCGYDFLWNSFASTILRFMSGLPSEKAITAPLTTCYSSCKTKSFDDDLKVESFDDDASSVSRGLSMVNLIVSLRKWVHGSNTTCPIPPSELVLACRDRQATEKEDKVYAVSALFNIKRRVSQDLRIKYGSPATTYREFSAWCIQEEGNLDVLAQQRYGSGDRSSNFTLPKWATDWTSTTKFTTTHANDILSNLSQDRMVAPHPSFKIDGDILALEGFVIDEIDEILVPPSKLIIDSLDLEQWRASIPDDKTANLVLFGEEKPTKQTLERLRDQTAEKDRYQPHLWRDGRQLTELRPERDYRDEWRVPVLTKRGCLAYTFLAPRGSRVCCFYGGRGLFILRPVSDKNGRNLYEFICGECFIYGLEDGRGIGVAQRLGLKKEYICII